MTPKEKFWTKFKVGDNVCQGGWPKWKSVNILKDCEVNEAIECKGFLSSEGNKYYYDGYFDRGDWIEGDWKLWTPSVKTKKIVLKPYVYIDHQKYNPDYWIGFRNKEWNKQSLIGIATFNPSDGTYSIEVNE